MKKLNKKYILAIILSFTVFVSFSQTVNFTNEGNFWRSSNTVETKYNDNTEVIRLIEVTNGSSFELTVAKKGRVQTNNSNAEEIDEEELRYKNIYSNINTNLPSGITITKSSYLDSGDNCGEGAGEYLTVNVDWSQVVWSEINPAGIKIADVTTSEYYWTYFKVFNTGQEGESCGKTGETAVKEVKLVLEPFNYGSFLTSSLFTTGLCELKGLQYFNITTSYNLNTSIRINESFSGALTSLFTSVTLNPTNYINWRDGRVSKPDFFVFDGRFRGASLSQIANINPSHDLGITIQGSNVFGVSQGPIYDVDVCTGDGYQLRGMNNSDPIEVVRKPNGSNSSMITKVGDDYFFDMRNKPQGVYEFYQQNSETCLESKYIINLIQSPVVSWTSGTPWEVCIDAELDLRTQVPDFIAPGSTFEIEGNTGFNFVASDYGAGTYDITVFYDNGNCVVSNTKQITIKDDLIIGGTESINLCRTSNVVDLSNLVDLEFSGPIDNTQTVWQDDANIVTSDGRVNPANLVPNVGYTVNLTFTTTTNCEFTKTITVSASNPQSSVQSYSVCLNDNRRILPFSGDWTYTPTTASNPIQSVGSVKYFNPSLASSGTVYILKSFDDNQCKSYEEAFEVTDDPGFVFNFGTEDQICKNADPINLLTYSNLKTDVTFSWTGGSGYQFNAGNLNAGQYPVTATYTNTQGCRFFQTSIIEVLDDITVEAGPDEIICLNSPSVPIFEVFAEATNETLTTSLPSNTGYWEGPSLVGTDIDVSGLEEGRTYQYTYNVNYGGCVYSDIAELTVVGLPDTYAGEDLILCNNGSSIALSSQGVWTNGGNVVMEIDPTALALNVNHIFTYTKVNNNGCEVSDSRIVVVKDPGALFIGNRLEVCANSNPVNLLNDVPVDDRVGRFTSNSNALNSSGFWDPSRTTPGVYSVTYTIEADGNRCFSQATREIEILPLPDLFPGFDQQVCQGDGPIRVDLNGTVGGVANSDIEYSGQGIYLDNGDYFFDGSSLVTGNYQVTATYEDLTTLCSVTKYKQIRITTKPAVSAGPDLFLCSSASIVNMTDGSPSGGVYSMVDSTYESAISSNRFDPSLVDPNKPYEILYTYQDGNGCASTATRTITIGNDVSISINPPSGNGFNYCETDNSVDLSPYVQPFAGGTARFSGVGITGTTFNPKVGPGSYTITYEWANEFGCSDVKTFPITVNNVPTNVFAGNKASICFNSAPYDVEVAASPKGGEFSGPGIVLDETDGKYYFDSNIAGAGTTTIFYTVTNASNCSITVEREIEVKPLAEISAGPNLTICRTSGFIDLNDGVVGEGTKIWSGDAVVESIVDPADLSVGIHRYDLVITQGNGCTAVSSKTINIVAEPEIIVQNDPLVVCDKDGLIGLNSDVNLKTTVWEGLGVVNGSNFDPSRVGESVITLTGTYVSPYNCESTITREIVVKKSPSISVGGIINTCSTAPPFSISEFGSPSGGQWSGPGLENGFFYPDRVGAGEFSLEYSYTSLQNCENTAIKTIIVRNPDPISAGPSLITCVNSQDIFLDEEASVEGATWEGRGTNLNIFSPSDAGIGTHQLKMTYDYGQGCIATAYRVIKVTEPLQVEAGPQIEICRGSGNISLTRDVSVSGGRFEGSYVNLDGVTFNSNEALPGTYQLEYAVSNSNSCEATDVLNVVVIGNPVITVGAQLSVCNTADSVEISSYFTPSQGTISSPYVVDGYFRPKGLAPGQYEVRFSVTNSQGCFSEKSKFVTVTDPEPIFAGEDVISCIDLGQINLEEGAGRSGAIWRAVDPNLQNAITTNYWDPQVSGVGTFEVEMLVNFGGGCISTDRKILKINPPLSVDAGEPLSFCASQGLKSISAGVNKTGGSWSGDFVTRDGLFDTDILEGTYEVQYTISNEYSCSATDTRIIEILPKPQISVGQAIEVCNTNINRINLFEVIPTDGLTITGPGIEEGQYFNGLGLLEGDYEIRLSKTNASGCISTSVKIISVVNPSPIITTDLIACEAGNPIQLDAYSNQQGAVFSGPFVYDNVFYPDSANIGNFAIDVEYNDGSGCISSGRLFATVRKPTQAIISDNILEFCADDNTSFDLNDLVNVRGGVWTGINSSGIVNPSDLQSGRTYNAKYTLTDDFLCSSQDSIQVVINEIPIVNSGVDIIECYLGQYISLMDGGQFPRVGGRFEGPGIVQDTLLNTASLGSGVHYIDYVYVNPVTGCSGVDQRKITLVEPPFVTIGSSKSMCISSGGYDLNRDVSDTTLVGEWTGPGIVGSMFESQLAGLGEHKVVFRAIAQGGCEIELERFITVVEEPVLVFTNSLTICKESGGENLTNHVNIPGGIWTSNSGLVEGTIFNPTTAKIGFYTVNYYVPSYLGCSLRGSMSIRVVEADSVFIGENIEMCIDSQPIDLKNETSRLGGSYSTSGDGIYDESMFDPQRAGLGVHLIEYLIVNNFNCPTIATRSINVVRKGRVSGGSSLSLCKGGGTYDLNDHDFSPGRGIYSGASITNNILNPNLLSAGQHEIYFSYDFKNGCIGTDTLTVSITDSDIVEFGNDTIVCITSGEIPLINNPSLEGGQWSNEQGKGGVLNNRFFAEIAGLGLHKLTYVKETDQCEIVGTRIIQVVNLPNTPQTDFDRKEGCVGETVELRALPQGENITGVEIAWYRKNEDAPFAFGRSVDFDIDSTETIYFAAVNINGCESTGRGEVTIVAKGPSGSIAAEKFIAFVNEPIAFSLTAENAQQFKWDFGDGTKSTERNPYHYFYRPGKFKVSLTITSAAGCTGVFELNDSITIENNGEYFEGIPPDTATVLASRDEFINGISAYPNPFRERINISVDLPNSEDLTVELYDMKGTLVSRKKYNKYVSSEGNIILELESFGLSNQMYMLIIKGEDYSKQIKIFKQN